jgi:rubrerythrin
MPTHDIQFAELSMLDALDLAILIEEEAEERYRELAHQLDAHRTPEPAAFFRFMAANEAKHRTRLAAHRTRLFHAAPRRMSRAVLWDVEAPDYDEARAFMLVRRAMETALRCEQKAHDFFAAALPEIRDPHVRALFEDLRDEEILHRDLVRSELDRLGPDPGVDPEDFTDEPTSQ